MLMGYRYVFPTFLNPALPSYRGPVNQMHGEPVTLDHRFRYVITPNADTPYSHGRARPAGRTDGARRPRGDRPLLRDAVRRRLRDFDLTIGSGPPVQTPAPICWSGPDSTATFPTVFTDVLHFESDLVFVIGRTQLLGPDDAHMLCPPIMEAYHLEARSRCGHGPPSRARVDWPSGTTPRLATSASSATRTSFCTLPAASTPRTGPHHRLPARYGPGRPSTPTRWTPGEGRHLGGRRRAAGRPMEATWATPGREVQWLAGREASVIGSSLPARTCGGGRGPWSDGAGTTRSRRSTLLLGRMPRASRSSVHRAYACLDYIATGEGVLVVTMYDIPTTGRPAIWSTTRSVAISINSTTEGLVRHDDGSLTISHPTRPAPTRRGAANWLPAPDGEFYLAMRIYRPEAGALDGTWEPPPVVRID